MKQIISNDPIVKAYLEVVKENYEGNDMEQVTSRLLQTDLLLLNREELDIFIEECQTWLENTESTMLGDINKQRVHHQLVRAIKQKHRLEKES